VPPAHVLDVFSYPLTSFVPPEPEPLPELEPEPEALPDVEPDPEPLPLPEPPVVCVDVLFQEWS
jgi:hypothetical protein